MLASLTVTVLAGLGGIVPAIASWLIQDPPAASSSDAQAAAAALEAERLPRLAQIAAALQDPEQDGALLLTEAVRRIGFVIWDEDRKVLQEPLGAPRLGLAITDAEIRDYLQMFRDGHTVQRDDLIGGLDVLYHSLGAEDSVKAPALTWLRDGTNTSNPSARALAVFLQDLGLQRAGADGRLDADGDVTLDPLQALLMLRVLTEDIGTPVRRAIGRGELGGGDQPADKAADKEEQRPRGPFVPEPTALLDEPPGWAEDAYAGGITGLFSQVVEGIGTWGKKVTDGVGKANAIASVAKFIATYTFLRGEVSVEAPGQPLVRTKNRDAGQQRTLVARFWIDGTKVTDWMKDHRQLVVLAGLDIDMPKTGALKGIETEWDIRQDRHSSKYHLIQTVRGQPDISKIKTDANGEARIRVEGAPQPSVLDPKKVMPIEKAVSMVVSPQVKSTEMQQDLLDAVTGAIGIKDGPAGFVGPIIECLYRTKWKGGRKFTLQVRDWQAGETIGQAEITLRARGSSFGRDWSNQISLDRSLRFTDVLMQSIGVEAPELPDPALLKMMPAAVRKQMEDGMRQLAELAKKRMFLAEGPGTAELHVHDAFSSHGEADGCVDGSVSSTMRSDGDSIVAFGSNEALQAMTNFQVEVDLDKRIARLTLRMSVQAKVVTVDKSNGKSKTTESVERASVFDGVRIQPPFTETIEIPLKETPVRDMEISNYYGAVSVPVTFGPQNRYSGTAIVAYSVTRKMQPK